jgi:hypothetical protein
MKTRNVIILIMLILAVLGISFVYYKRTRAQQDVVEFLKNRLQEKNISLVGISVIEPSPHLHLEITFRGLSEGETSRIDQLVNADTVKREIFLASQYGYTIEKVTIIRLDQLGKQVGWEEIPVDAQYVNFHVSPAALDDRATKNIVLEKMDLGGWSLVDATVMTSEGLQTLTIRLSTPSLEEANKILDTFLSSLRPFLDNINTQGAQIVTCIVELSDEKGQLLLAYLYDLQIHEEMWWNVDGLKAAWFGSAPFSHPKNNYPTDTLAGTPTYTPVIPQTDTPTKTPTDTPTIVPTDTPTETTTPTP